MSTLDNLRKEAKRWLKALQANNPAARQRLLQAWPGAPTTPVLRDVQHALAREHGLSGWSAFKARHPQTPITEAEANAFLDAACWNHHIRGRREASIRAHTAMALLHRHPQLARYNLYTAIVCGELNEVRTIIARHPDAARQSGGPRGWTPLLYLTYARLPLPQSAANTVAIAQILLDNGANPNDFYHAGDVHYTALVGVAGEGEQDALPHPNHNELYQLLLQHGAGPYDLQVLYNTHFHGNVLWWLQLTYAQCLATGRKSDWDNPDWNMLDIGVYGCGARYLLNLAILHNDLPLAAWLLAHGANPNAAPPSDWRYSKRTLYEDALMLGHDDMAQLLLRHGAKPVTPTWIPEEEFLAAAFRRDEQAARRILAIRPDLLRSIKALFAAADQDRPEAIAFLLDLGVPANLADHRGQHALHMAAVQNAVRAAAVLIARGAPVDPVEWQYKATPFGYATHYQHAEMIALLTPHSADVRCLAFNGKLDRLRQVLTAQPELARKTNAAGETALWSLPNDEDLAIEIAALLIGHGADPAATASGVTAADHARKRGMHRLAACLGRTTEPPPPTAELISLEQLARDMLIAYETGDATALHNVGAHFRRTLTWDNFRAALLDRMKRMQASNASTILTLDDTRFALAREAGFPNWDEFSQALQGATPKEPAFQIDRKDNNLRTHRAPLRNDWDAIFTAIREHAVTGINSGGRFTDDALHHLAAIPHVTHLNLEGSRQITAAGWRHLARMPQLQSLNLIGCAITDDDLAVLRALPELREITMCHQWRITDAGIAHLEHAHKLEHADLMNTGTGDGALRSLAAKPNLRFLKAGNNVTAAGMQALHGFPAFRSWQGGHPTMSLMSPDAGPTFLWLFLQAAHLNPGIAQLRALDGLYGISIHGGAGEGPFDGHDETVTPANLDPLKEMANLGWLGIAGDLCTDAAMQSIGALPNLRMLMAQGTVATAEGFAALSRSQTLAYLWGRECPGLTSQAFRALATMPSLRGLAVSCQAVDDEALALLPHFPALRELLPMDVTDKGFRHVGACTNLQALWCMYCRETTDQATQHIAHLQHLRTYYAGRTLITDRSLQILGAMPTLEQIRFWQCAALTNAGLAHLAKLPRLRELGLEGGMPGITLEGTKVFRPEVGIDYWP